MKKLKKIRLQDIQVDEALNVRAGVGTSIEAIANNISTRQGFCIKQKYNDGRNKTSK